MIDPNDTASKPQRGYIISLLYHVSPRVSAHTPESEWIAELNSLCNLNIQHLTDLTHQEASKVITQLKAL